MPESKIDRRLMRVVGSLRSHEDPEKYVLKLRQLADSVARIDEAEKRCKIFKALADNTRLRILKLLNVREMCVCEIMMALDLTQPTASHHLKILENAGLVKSRKEGRWVHYSLTNSKAVENLFKLSLVQPFI